MLPLLLMVSRFSDCNTNPSALKIMSMASWWWQLMTRTHFILKLAPVKMKINALQIQAAQASSIFGHLKQQSHIRFTAPRLITSSLLASAQSSKLVTCTDSQKEKVPYCSQRHSIVIPIVFSTSTTTLIRSAMQEESTAAFLTLLATLRITTVLYFG